MSAMRVTLSMLALLTAPAVADESQVQLKSGGGKELVDAYCAICHSLDYIQMNSIFLDRKAWEASVSKMIKAFGAPIRAEDVPQLVDYLTRHYGK